MTPLKVLVTGPTGFIGTRMCERLHLHYKLPVRAAVRSFGNAARVARMGTEMVSANLLVPASLARALEGCDVVIHLAHGDDADAPRATANLVAASKKAGVKRFVHVSSMSVHGPAPGPESAHENSARISRYGESYCDAKAEEEELVRHAIQRDGLPAVILRPTVVYGPYSAFVVQAVMAARSGEVQLIDQGAGVCNAVYVDDVCDALYAALKSDRAIGEAMFINADHTISWKEFILTFANLVDPPPVISSISSTDVERYWASQNVGLTENLKAARQLARSPEFHQQLSTIPIIGKAIRSTKGVLRQVLSQESISAVKRRNIEAATDKTSARAGWPNMGRMRRETVSIQFSNEKAKTLLDWRPQYEFHRGAELTRAWLEFARLVAPMKLLDLRGTGDVA
jgi:nucleoside-diphosphate-sugar epimerase